MEGWMEGPSVRSWLIQLELKSTNIYFSKSLRVQNVIYPKNGSHRLVKIAYKNKITIVSN